MKILLIGGTGILSSAVTDEALQCGISVTMINRGKRRIPENVELIKSDCKELEYIQSKLDGRFFDAIIDFLCYTPEQLKRSFEFYSNYTQQYLFISSCAVYDTSIPVEGLYSEESPKIRAIWPYSVDKWNCEELLSQLSHNTKCHYTIVRPCLTYGNTRIPYGVMPEFGRHWTFVARILSGKPIIRWNKGQNRWNMMRVEDFAVGLVGLIGRQDAFGEAFNICGDEMPSNNDVLKAIEKHLGVSAKLIDIPIDFYANELPWICGEILGGRGANLICSNEKIKRYVPRFAQNISLEQGVSMTIDAYKKDNYQLGIDWKYDAMTDYIIEKWCKKNNISSRGLNLHFIDYLHNCTFGDRELYRGIRYRNSKMYRSFMFGKRAVVYLQSKIKSLFSIY